MAAMVGVARHMSVAIVTLFMVGTDRVCLIPVFHGTTTEIITILGTSD